MAARTLLLSCGALAPLWLPLPVRADRIVLRNLDVLDGVTATAVDEDGVQLEDGVRITWDRIEQGRVGAPLQAEFDRLLGALGADLYRVRQRLSVGDYAGARPQAEALADRYAGRHSDTAYLVFRALLGAHLAAGEREAALAPFLRCLDLQRAADTAGRALEAPGLRPLSFDPDTGLMPALAPLWFDRSAAAAALPAAGQAISDMVTPPLPGVRVYYATLALAAGAPEKAESARAGLAAHPALAALVDAEARLAEGAPAAAIPLLEPHLPALGAPLRGTALYVLGRARTAAPDVTEQRAGLLQLLTLPAAYSATDPELAAAALDAALQTLAAQGDAKGSIALRRELLDRYGTTWHARKIRAEDQPAKEPP